MRNTPEVQCIKVTSQILLLISLLAISDAKVNSTTQKLILSMHNSMRRKVGLKGLVWDNELSKLAERLARTCVFRHDNPISRRYGRVGQNIAAHISVQKGVQAWIDEKRLYNYASNTCRGECGHYTQIVARRSKKIGCAVKNCTGRWAHNYYIVCNYAPAGNFNNRRPY